MRRRCAILGCIYHLVMFFSTGVAFGDAAQTLRELQAFAREIAQTGKAAAPPPYAGSTDVTPLEQKFSAGQYDSGPGPTFIPPQMVIDGGVLWYDLGMATVDSLYYDFNVSFESMQNVYDGSGDSAPDFYEYPFKAQLLVEVIRRFFNTNEQQAQWRNALLWAESLVAQEVTAIDKAATAAKANAQQNDDVAIELAERELVDQLFDYDARIFRVILGNFDQIAAKSNLSVRRYRPRSGPAGAAGSEPLQVAFRLDNPATAYYAISRSAYLMTKWQVGEGNVERYVDEIWAPVTTDHFPHGQTFVVAIWLDPQSGSGSRVQCARAVQWPVQVLKNGTQITFSAPKSIELASPMPQGDQAPQAPRAPETPQEPQAPVGAPPAPAPPPPAQ